MIFPKKSTDYFLHFQLMKLTPIQTWSFVPSNNLSYGFPDPFLNSSKVQGGEGNGIPLQSSCLENPMDRGVWQAAVQGVAKSRTRLSDFTFMHWRRKWQPTPGFVTPGKTLHSSNSVSSSKRKIESYRIGWKDLSNINVHQMFSIMPGAQNKLWLSCHTERFFYQLP